MTYIDMIIKRLNIIDRVLSEKENRQRIERTKKGYKIVSLKYKTEYVSKQQIKKIYNIAKSCNFYGINVYK